MFINFLNQNINFTPKMNGVKFNANTASNSIMFGANYDTFEKSNADVQNTKNVTTSNITWNEEGLKTLLDDVYADVVENNPISKELNIKKPNILISENTEGTVTYNFAANNISFEPNVSGDYCMCIAIDGDGNETNLGIFSRKRIKELMETIKERGYDVEISKLNNKEKEAYIKSLVAHELRHCIQTHLMASTEGVMDEHFEFIDSRYKKLDSIVKRAIAMGCNPSKVDFPELYNNAEPYYQAYVPKKVFEDDVMLKFSTKENDNRYLSTRRHLLNPTLERSAHKNSVEFYKADPVEIDANNCALEYFLKLRKQPKYADMRENISNGIAHNFFSSAKTGITTMKNFGYPPLIKK